MSRTHKWLLALTIVLITCLSTVQSPAQQAPSVRAMRLLTSQSGWGSAGNRLLLTSNGGRAWDDITPQWESGAAVDGVLFRDAQTGWVMLHTGGNAPRNTRVAVASTSDAGRTWTV